MNTVLYNIGRAIDKFFAERERPPLDIIDHGDPDAGRTYIKSMSATASTFNLAQRNLDNYDILTSIAPAEFWLEVESNALD